MHLIIQRITEHAYTVFLHPSPHPPTASVGRLQLLIESLWSATNARSQTETALTLNYVLTLVCFFF